MFGLGRVETTHTESSRLRFQEDFFRMEQMVAGAISKHRKPNEGGQFKNAFTPIQTPELLDPVEDVVLNEQQAEFSNILENACDHNHAKQMLVESPLAQSAWQIEHWAPEMLGTAVRIAQNWKSGFD